MSQDYYSTEYGKALCSIYLLMNRTLRHYCLRLQLLIYFRLLGWILSDTKHQIEIVNCWPPTDWWAD